MATRFQFSVPWYWQTTEKWLLTGFEPELCPLCAHIINCTFVCNNPRLLRLLTFAVKCLFFLISHHLLWFYIQYLWTINVSECKENIYSPISWTSWYLGYKFTHEHQHLYSFFTNFVGHLYVLANGMLVIIRWRWLLGAQLPEKSALCTFFRSSN